VVYVWSTWAAVALPATLDGDLADDILSAVEHEIVHATPSSVLEGRKSVTTNR
jgi:hypothetical protein